jgi:SPP1 family predicted phage head-tail adaptor
VACRCRLRERVALQRPTRTTTTDGTLEDWASYRADVAAEILPTALVHTERQVEATVQTPVSHLVTIRYRSEVRAADRVLYRTQAFYILRIRHLHKDLEHIGTHWTEMACEERAA